MMTIVMRRTSITMLILFLVCLHMTVTMHPEYRSITLSNGCHYDGVSFAAPTPFKRSPCLKIRK